MVRVTGIDHLVLSVGNFKASKAFYAPLMAFLGFKLEAEYEGMMGWHNDKTLFWIAAADAKGRKHKYRKGDIGFHHYAFRLRSRKDVDALQAFLKDQGVDTAIYYPLSLHEQECFASLGYKRGDFPESEKAAAETLALPIYPELTDEQIVTVADKVKEFLG